MEKVNKLLGSKVNWLTHSCLGSLFCERQQLNAIILMKFNNVVINTFEGKVVACEWVKFFS